MACINPDGTLSIVARRILEHLEHPADPPGLASALDLPLWRVRATLRAIGRAGLVAADLPDAPATFRISELGREALAIDRETAT